MSYDFGNVGRNGKKIAARLKLPPVSEFIHIEDIASEEEMELAHEMRTNQGQHVIPVPTFEIKKDFSGYFLHPLRRLQRNMDDSDANFSEPDKSIVRPTFSYMGDYTISDKVIIAIAMHETERFPEVEKIVNINLRKTVHGVHIDMTLSLRYGCEISRVCREIQRAVRYNIEMYTSINARRVHIFVKNIVTD